MFANTVLKSEALQFGSLLRRSDVSERSMNARNYCNKITLKEHRSKILL